MTKRQPQGAPCGGAAIPEPLGAAVAVAKRQEIFEKAKRFEDKVAELFRFLGYSTVVDYQKDDLQFDVRLEMPGGPLPAYALVECKDTQKPAGQKQIREFASKVEHARRSDVLPYQALLVSRSGFVNNAHEVARQQFVTLRTFEQLIQSLVNFGPNLESVLGAFRGTELERLYVEQDVLLQSARSQGLDALRPHGLSQTVLSWLDQPHGTLLALLGDFGAGKTSFCKRLAADLATRLSEHAGSARIPLVIDLRTGGSTTVTLENLLTHHFQCLSSQPLNPQSLLHLNREGYLVLFFDGFDEVVAYSEPSRHVEHLRQILRAAEGRAKVILTCRTHYFRDQPEELRHFSHDSQMLSTQGATILYRELTSRPGVDIAYLREFTDEQIDEYLRKALPPRGDWRRLRHQIRQTYDLPNLGERPFLLDMIVKTLPTVLGETRAGHVSLTDLYETYCESWFTHTDFRLTLTRERKVALVEHLARTIWDAPSQRVHYQALYEGCTAFFCDQPLTPQEKERIDFEVRTALFLHRNAEGYYSFIHRSFLEFFVARTVRAGIAAGDPSCLDCRRLTREVVLFLTFWPEAERIPRFAGQILAGPFLPRISENALQLLYLYARSGIGPLVGQVAEDSIDSLRMIHQRFQELRPQAIQLTGADLEDSDLRGACLDDARLDGAKLDRALLQGASFARARLDQASLASVEAWGANFAEANLSRAFLQHARCLDANLRGADLAGADFSFARFDSRSMRCASLAALVAIEAGSSSLRDAPDGADAATDQPLARRLTVLYVQDRAELRISRIGRPSALVVASRDRPLPPSWEQQRIWFSSRLDAGLTPTLLLPLALLGRLSVPAFQQAVDEVVRRHEILRSTYRFANGESVQDVAVDVDTRTPLVDLRRLSAPRRPGEARRLLAEARRLHFDLESGPLFRVTLLALEEQHYLAMVRAHRIVSDERSMELLTRDLGVLYQAFSHGRPSPLPEVAIHFADAAQWQRRTWSSDSATELTYWRQRLAGAAPLELPTDHPRPVFGITAGACLRRKLQQGPALAVRTLAQRRGATPQMAFLAVFKLLLSRYAASRDVIVGLHGHGRYEEALENVIGPLANILVIRTDLSGSPTYEDVLDRVREGALCAYAYGLPFPRLLEELRPERSLSQTPLFQITFACQKAPEMAHFDDLTVTRLELETAFVETDLSLSLFAAGAGLDANLAYRAGMFDRSTLHRLLGCFENVLAQVASQPQVRLEDLAILSPSERHQAVYERNDTTRSFAHSALCLHELVEMQVRRTPTAKAVAFEGVSLTYSELDAQADHWSRELGLLGVGPEVSVAVCLDRSLEMVVGILAVLKAGGAYVPLDPAYPPERLHFLLADSRAPVLLTQKRFLARLPQDGARVLCLDAPDPQPGRTTRPTGSSATCPSNLCYVMYTSGSTGRPKGVMSSHAGIVNRLLAMQAEYELTADDRVLQKTSFSYDVSVWELFWPLVAGACVVLARPRGQMESHYIARAIADEGITTLHFVPAILRIFLEEGALETSCASLRRVLVSGESLPAELQERFLQRFRPYGVELHCLYGPTEAAIDVTSCRIDEAVRATPLGCPVANARVFLLDEQLRPVPIGAPGQLYIGGVQLARGYTGRPDLTAERFLPDLFSSEGGSRLYASGDLARYGAAGGIEFLGRIDHQVKVRGFRIELGEIESTLASYPGVRAVAVLAREGSSGDRQLVAYIAPEATPPAVGTLRSFLQSRLPDYMVPARFVFLAALPLTPSGKLDRRVLPAPPADAVDLSTDYVAPRTAIERNLAAIWTQLLGIERIGVHHDFFAMGGHSLLALQLVARTRAVFNVALPLRQVFESPTIAEQAQLLGRQAGNFEAGDQL